MKKHFETAQFGSKAARNLLILAMEHGPALRVESRPTVTYSFVGSEHVEDVLHLVFEDGHAERIPAYAGDSLDRIERISKLSWDESVDEMFTDESLRDSTGAILEMETA